MMEEGGAEERGVVAPARVVRRAANEKYVLVFWKEDPRSADVVLKTEVLPDERYPLILAQQDRKVMWGQRAFDARIIATGLKGDLVKIKVSRDGEVLQDCGPTTEVVTTRARAISILEARASNNRLAATDELDQLVLVAAEAPARVVVDHHTADDIAEAEENLKGLPCRTAPAEGEKDNYVQLGKNIFAEKVEVHYILRRYKKRPVKMFRALLVLLLTQAVIDQRCLSVSGRGTAKVPEDILKTALSYTSLNSKGGDFSVTKTVSNLLLHKKK